jgi:hypothetical protein
MMGVAAGLAAAAVTGCTVPAGPEGEIDAVFGDLAGEARAVAACESHMNPAAVSRTNDHGLFQINIVHKAAFSQVTGQPWAAVYDAHFNSQFARWMYDRQGWRPWTCRYAVGG